LTTAPERQATRSPRKYRRKKAVAKSLVPVRVIPDVGQQPPTAHSIEIAWPNGMALRVPTGCDLKMLRDVFGLLLSAMKDEIGSC
jgi:hypothetical protein